MNDETFETQRARVLAIVERWKPVIAYGWRLDVAWSRGPFQVGGAIDAECVGAIGYAWDYLEATVTFDLAQCETLSDERIEEVVVHELSHLLVAPAVESGSRSVLLSRKEHMTTLIARSLLAARGDGGSA